MTIRSIAPLPPAAVRIACVVLALAALAQCSTGTEPGLPGTVTYRLVSPNGAEGAFLARAPAAEVTGVPEGDGATVVLFTTVAGEVHVAVVHRFGAEDLTFELEVADASDPPVPTLVEVAGPDDRLRDLAGYSLEIVP